MKKKTNPVYENLETKAARGDYSLVEPLDYLLIEHLFPEGTMFAGAYPKGHTSVQVAAELFNGEIPVATIAPRLKLLSVQGLTCSQKGVGTGGSPVWQSTEKGRDLAAAWRKEQG